MDSQFPDKTAGLPPADATFQTTWAVMNDIAFYAVSTALTDYLLFSNSVQKPEQYRLATFTDVGSQTQSWKCWQSCGCCDCCQTCGRDELHSDVSARRNNNRIRELEERNLAGVQLWSCAELTNVVWQSQCERNVVVFLFQD